MGKGGRVNRSLETAEGGPGSFGFVELVEGEPVG